MLEVLNQWIGVATPVVVIFVGGFFALRLRGLPFLRPKASIRAIRGGGMGDSSPLKSLMLALAGTLGVGNIVGVSSAIALGGAGAVFWMWVSALFAMFLKYAEVVLAMLFRETRPDGSHRGGAPYYIRAILGKWLPKRLASLTATVFALLCIANSLMMGCVIQSNAVTRAMDSAFSIPPLFCGCFLAVLCFGLLTKGKRAITAVTGILVPIMSGAFLVLSLAVLVLHRGAILPALGRIFSEAFSPLAAGGGIVGFLLSRSLRFGTIRGIISNEAGCGTSPTAHAASDTKSPVEQGLFGILEVAVDTLVLCTVTALVVLIGYDASAPFASDPMVMTLQAYSSCFGGSPWVEKALSLSILCFGFATLLCWSHYGTEALAFVLQNKKMSRKAGGFTCVFSLLFSLFAILGALSAPDLVWSLTDFITGMMTLINASVLLVGHRQICRVTDWYFGGEGG